MTTRVALLGLWAAGAGAFVLMGENASVGGGPPVHLPGKAYRWSLPAETSSNEGLGGGISWVLDPAFCDHLISRFPERSLIRGVTSFVTFISCSDIHDAVIRGLNTWSANHKHVSFNDISASAPCASPSASIDDGCPWELYIGTENGGDHPSLAAYVVNHRRSKRDARWYTRPVRSPSGATATGVDAHWRSVMRFQTGICWYLDATFCYAFHSMDRRSSLPDELIT